MVLYKITEGHKGGQTFHKGAAAPLPLLKTATVNDYA